MNIHEGKGYLLAPGVMAPDSASLILLSGAFLLFSVFFYLSFVIPHS